MGLGVALVDRGCVVGLASTGERVEGTTRFLPVSGQWFKLRLTLNAAPEDNAEASRRKTTRGAEIMWGMRDTQGGPIRLSAKDRVHVRSTALGEAIYEVTGDPVPIRKKSRVIGYTAPVVFVSEHVVEA